MGVGATQFIENDKHYLYANIAFRFLEGVGDAWIQTAGYSLISLKFPHNREKFIAQGEIASGIGLMAGPGLAGFLYTYLGYFSSFFCFVVFIGVSGLLCLFFIPESINQSCRDDSQSEDEDTIEDPDEAKHLADHNDISYSKFFRDRRIIFSLITCTYCCFLFQFSSSFFVTVLEYEKKVPVQYNGAIVSFGCLTYMMTTILTERIIFIMPKRLFILLSFSLLSIGLFF